MVVRRLGGGHRRLRNDYFLDENTDLRKEGLWWGLIGCCLVFGVGMGWGVRWWEESIAC